MVSGLPACRYGARANGASMGFPGRSWRMTDQRSVPMALADLRALAGRYGAGTPGTHAEVDRCSRSEAAQPKGNSGLAEGGTPGTPGTPEIASVGGITAT